MLAGRGLLPGRLFLIRRFGGRRIDEALEVAQLVPNTGEGLDQGVLRSLERADGLVAVALVRVWEVGHASTVPHRDEARPVMDRSRGAARLTAMGEGLSHRATMRAWNR